MARYTVPFRTITLDISYSADLGASGMEKALDVLDRAGRAGGARRLQHHRRCPTARSGPARIPIPSLLATSAVHHHLIRKGLRTSVGLVVETGEAHEVHQFCTLAGYGAEAINPYLAFETIEAMLPEIDEPIGYDEAVKRYIKAISKGILKVMSKMGISTYQSYCGAQIFDAVGLQLRTSWRSISPARTPRSKASGWRRSPSETAERHRQAFGDVPVLRNALEVGGEYAYRIRGEAHMWRPETVASLQHAVRANVPDKFREFSDAVNDQSEQLMTLRGLFRIKDAAELGRTPIPLEEVEPARRDRQALLDRAPCPSARSAARRIRRSPSP